MSIADEILEISDDLTGVDAAGNISPVYERMDCALDHAGAVGLVRIQAKVKATCWTLIPADGVIIAPTKEAEDAVEAMMAAIFTIGMVYGREHALRGYTLPD